MQRDPCFVGVERKVLLENELLWGGHNTSDHALQSYSSAYEPLHGRCCCFS